MPYDTDHNQLQRLIEQALAEKELRDSINTIAQEKGFSEEFLLSQVVELCITNIDESSVWSAARGYIDDITSSETTLKERIQSQPASPSLPPSSFIERMQSIVILLVIFSIGISVATAVFFGCMIGWTGLLNTLSSSQPVLIGGLLLIILFFVTVLTYLFANIRHRRQLQPYNLHLQAYRKAVDELKPIAAGLESKIASSKEAANQAVIQSGIMPALREIIGGFLERSYILSLDMLTHEGLAEVRNERYDIPTPASSQLSRLFDNMRGGSIGLAGPRGAGKTTLMYSFCQALTLGPQQRPVLSVMASAPVKYESRDFIILIFKLICQRLLALYGEAEATPGIAMNRELDETRVSLFQILRTIYMLFGRITVRFFLPVIALTLLALGIMMALSVPMPDPGTDPTLQATQPVPAPIAATTSPQPTAQAASTAPAPIATATSPQPTFQAAPAVTPATGSSTNTTASARLLALIAQVGVTPPNLIRLAFLLIFITFVLHSVGKYVEREQYRVESKKVEFQHSEQLRQRVQNRQLQQEQLSYAEQQERNLLTDTVSRWLRELRFQQSFSSGWSGALKLPIGLETGVESSMELAQRQQSLPEIIDGFQTIVRELTQKFTMVIAIDELDKIGTAEEAYSFLNGIKALFGVDHCFYLVSVSENAMSNFERRGLPIRDAFDSSFDKIIYVNYLDYQTSQRLINRRVIGIPAPFIALCYCLSGGLPRDLIRSCRTMFEVLASDEAHNSLSSIANAMILTDVKIKLQAIAIAAKQMQATDEASAFLTAIQTLDGSLTQPSQELFETNEFFKHSMSDAGSLGESVEVSEIKKSLQELMTELQAYLYYQFTLRDYFAHLDIERFKQDETHELNKLARSHQLFAYSIVEARKIITQFRRSHKLEFRTIVSIVARECTTTAGHIAPPNEI